MGACAVCAGIIVGEDSARRPERISSFFVEVGEEMLVLVTYDVSTQDAVGRARLRKVAKECVNYG